VTDTAGVSEGVVRTPGLRVSALGALGLGALCVLVWVAGLLALFANLDTDESGMVATVAVLVIVVLAALSTIPARSAGSVVAGVGAVLYGGIWTYLRVGFDRMMPDAILTILTILFFVAPLVTGVAAVVVGARRLKG